MAIRPWHDDNGEELSYRGAGIIDSDFAETLDDFGEGHWFKSDSLFSKRQYAYKQARDGLGLSAIYILLVKVENKKAGTIGWKIMVTRKPWPDLFPSE